MRFFSVSLCDCTITLLLLRHAAALAAGCRGRGNGPGDELGAATLTGSRKHDVLIALMHISHRQTRLRARWQFCLPEALAGLLVVRMEDGLSTRTFAREQKVLRHEQSCLRR